MSASVLPARAGMSPSEPGECHAVNRAPRASGDEPRIDVKEFTIRGCSPRERG